MQLLVCGQTCATDAYGQRCARQISNLRSSYPYHFWASSLERHFEDGLLVTAAADFGARAFHFMSFTAARLFRFSCRNVAVTSLLTWHRPRFIS